jgi:general secretion pathway protein G
MPHCTRSGRAELRLIDAVLLAVVVAIAGAVAIPLIEKASGQAKEAALLQNLRTLRSQIELYKLEHGGEPPVAYQGSFPQLLRATNARGVPGEAGSQFPYGPYLHTGIPVNPVTGCSIVTLTDTFPPQSPGGSGGWLYHQQTGRIAIDLEGFLTE